MKSSVYQTYFTLLYLDDELRKKYDTYGEEGLKDDHYANQYQSWNFYNEQFGIYDDDPEIITLSKADFGLFTYILFISYFYLL